MQQKEHFSSAKLIASPVAARAGIENQPSLEVVANLRHLARQLETVRSVLGNKPIHITSGYRSAALNIRVGGRPHSAHIMGRAADIVCPQFGNPLEVCLAIARAPEVGFDQLIHEFRQWCHVSFPAVGIPARTELLTILSNASGYQ